MSCLNYIAASNMECPVFATGAGARHDSMEGSCRVELPGHL